VAAGPWIRCPQSLRPTLSGSLVTNVGFRDFGNTTFVNEVWAALGLFVVMIKWTNTLVDSGMGSWPILLPPADPEGKFYDEFTVSISANLQGIPEEDYELEFTDVNGAHSGDLIVGNSVIQKFYVGDDDPGTSYPVTCPFTMSAGYRLLRQLNTNPPATRGLRYWWDCDVVDGWNNELGNWFQASITGPAGTQSARYRLDTVVTGEQGLFGAIAYGLGFNNQDGYLQSFAAIDGEYARVDAGLGGVGDPALATESEDFGDWHTAGDADGVALTYDGAPTQGWMPSTWTYVGSLPAVVTPALSGWDTGGPAAESRTDPQIIITGPTPQREQGISATDAFAVGGGTAVSVTVDADWATTAGELAEVTRDAEDNLPSANNLPVKLDVPPPLLGLGSPYWEGPAALGVWSALDLMQGTRLRAAVNTVPWDAPDETEQTIPAGEFWEANKTRWSIAGDHLSGVR